MSRSLFASQGYARVSLQFVAMAVVSVAAILSPGAYAEKPVLAGPDFIAVKNPKRLPARLACKRIPLGLPGDYKPSLARLKNGELLLVAFADYDYIPSLARRKDPKKLNEYFICFRSKDGGVTWSPRQELKGVLGREPFLTVLRDGTILMSCHIGDADVKNKEGFWYSFVHRSTDGGRTWSTLRLGADGFPPPGKGTASDRRAVELPDGTVLLGVSTGMDDGNLAYMWRSRDHGKTWDKSTRCDTMGWRDVDGFFSNSETFRLPSGKLLHINRVDGSNHPIKGRPFPGRKGDDNTDRSRIWESTDNGATWRNPRDFGDYGEMYPQLFRLRDGRLLCNFTVRGLKYPLGIQAIISYDDGQTWDFEHDRIIVESRTPQGKPSGGGYGNAIQLPDGTLITCYSYRGNDDNTYLEVVRWRLPNEL